MSKKTTLTTKKCLEKAIDIVYSFTIKMHFTRRFILFESIFELII